MPEGQKCLPHVWKRRKKQNCFQNSKNCIFFLATFQFTCWMQLWQPCQKIFAERPKPFPLSAKVIKKGQFFQKKASILKVFLWNRKMYFWKSRQKFLDQKPRNFRPTSESDKKFVSFQVFLLNLYFYSGRNQFGEPPPKIFHRCPKFFEPVCKNVKKPYFLPGKNFLSNCSPGQVEVNLDNPADTVWP